MPKTYKMIKVRLQSKIKKPRIFEAFLYKSDFNIKSLRINLQSELQAHVHQNIR